jgi:hypothetical protein
VTEAHEIDMLQEQLLQARLLVDQAQRDIPTDPKADTNPLVERLYLARFFAGQDVKSLVALVENNTYDTVLKQALTVLLDICRASCKSMQCGPWPVRREYNRRSLAQDPATGFNCDLQDSSLVRYIWTWRKIFAFVLTISARQSRDESGLLVRLNAAQMVAAQNMLHWRPDSDKPALVRDLVLSLARQSTHDEVLRMPLLAALAILVIKPSEAAFHTASTLPAHYAHVVKIVVLVSYAQVEFNAARRLESDPNINPPGQARFVTPGATREPATLAMAVTSSSGASAPAATDGPDDAVMDPLDVVSDDWDDDETAADVGGLGDESSTVHDMASIQDMLLGIAYLKVGDGRETPMTWIYHAQTVARAIRVNTVAEPSVVWRSATGEVSGWGITLSLEQLGAVAKTAISQTTLALDQLLLGATLADVSLPDVNELLDDRQNTILGMHVGKLPANEPWAANASGFLPGRVSSLPHWRDGARLSRDAVNRYEQQCREFLFSLLVTVYVTSGQPPRGTELVPVKWSNTSVSLRNLFFDEGRVALRTDWAKQNWNSFPKVVWRFLPPCLSRVVLAYLTVVLPFRQSLAALNGYTGGLNPSLFTSHSVGSKDYFDSRDLTTRLQKLTETVLGKMVNPQKWRHFMCKFGEHCLPHGSMLESLLGVPGATWRSIAEEDNDIVDEQASHSTHTRETIYAVEFDRGPKYYKFAAVSRQWHILLGLYGAADHVAHAETSALRQRDLASEQTDRLVAQIGPLGDDLTVRAWLHSADAATRVHQRHLLDAMRAGHATILYVAGTGGGKSIAYQLPATISRDGITVVIQPLRALIQQSLLQLQDRGVRAVVWSGDADPALAAQVVLVTPEAMTSESWNHFVECARQDRKLDRVVLDEAQEVINCRTDFRLQLQNVGSHMAKICPRRIFVTGTLPPTCETQFFATVEATPETTFTVRSPCTRPELRYVVASVADVEAMQTLIASSYLSGLPSDKRAILYCQEVATCKALARFFGVPAYYSDMSDADKAAGLRKWHNDRGLIVATSALGLGINVDDVVLIIVTRPFTLIDVLQMFGRAGRDQSPATCVYMHDLSYRGASLEVKLLVESTCRRQLISEYLDGEPVVCGFQHNPCDLCAPLRSTASADTSSGAQTTNMPTRASHSHDPLAAAPLGSVDPSPGPSQFTSSYFDQPPLRRVQSSIGPEAPPFSPPPPRTSSGPRPPPSSELRPPPLASSGPRPPPSSGLRPPPQTTSGPRQTSSGRRPPPDNALRQSRSFDPLATPRRTPAEIDSLAAQVDSLSVPFTTPASGKRRYQPDPPSLDDQPEPSSVRRRIEHDSDVFDSNQQATTEILSHRHRALENLHQLLDQSRAGSCTYCLVINGSGSELAYHSKDHLCDRRVDTPYGEDIVEAMFDCTRKGHNSGWAPFSCCFNCFAPQAWDAPKHTPKPGQPGLFTRSSEPCKYGLQCVELMGVILEQHRDMVSSVMRRLGAPAALSDEPDALLGTGAAGR